MPRSPAGSVYGVMAEVRQIHMDTESCGGKGMAQPLSREESALVVLNGLTRARKIAADAWEREQGSCLLKKVQLQSGRKKGQPRKKTLSSEIQHSL